MNVQSGWSLDIDKLLKRSLLLFIVIVFFCNIAIYLSLVVSARLEPQYWLGLLTVFVIILAALSRQHRFEVFRTPLFFWCVLFIGLTVIVFLTVPNSYFQQVKERIRDVVLLVVLTGAFLMLRNQLGFLRKLVFLAVLLGVLINMISIVHNRFLLPEHIQYAARPAGFYINPNESATALILGMILSISILPKRWRIPYVAMVFVGVLATFSREAIGAWIIVTGLLCIFGMIDWKKLLIWTLALVALAAFSVFILIETKIINVHVAWYYQQQLHRLSWFVHGIKHGTSADTRLNLVKEAWDLFLQHPWIGNGIGSTEHWGLHYSTHNMYLYFMDDYGITGLLLFPLLVWCVCRESRGEMRKIAYCMAAFLLFWGLLDHDVVRNYYSLFAISLMAAMSRISATTSNAVDQDSATDMAERKNANPAPY